FPLAGDRIDALVLERCQSRLSRRWLCPESLAGQQFPVATLLLPDLQNADLGAGELTIGFAFGRPRMARDRIVADDSDGVTGQAERFDDPLSGHTPLDELGLVLPPATRMTVAQLPGPPPLQLALPLTKNPLPHPLSRRAPRSSAGGCAHCWGSPPQAH